MAMIVEITNITDAPDSKKPPTQLAVYTQKIDPGEVLRLPAHLVDKRLRDLEKDGYVVIGQVPSWYSASQSRRVGKAPLTREELEKKLVTKKEPEPEVPLETETSASSAKVEWEKKSKKKEVPEESGWFKKKETSEEIDTKK